MANDQPTSLRRGYGYHQARAAGLDGIRQDRSPRQVNRIISDRKIAKQLWEEVAKDPEWGPFVEHWILDGMSAETTYNALYRAQGYARSKAKGYSLESRLRHWW